MIQIQKTVSQKNISEVEKVRVKAERKVAEVVINKTPKKRVEEEERSITKYSIFVIDNLVFENCRKKKKLDADILKIVYRK